MKMYWAILLMLFSSQSAWAGLVGGSGGPPPATFDGLDLEVGILKIEQVIDDMVEVSDQEYKELLIDAALNKAVFVNGRYHNTTLLDLTRKRIFVEDKATKRTSVIISREKD